MRENSEIFYEEIRLPFEKLEHDHIEGEKLYEAVEYSLQNLSKYDLTEEKGSLKAYKGSKLKSVFSSGTRPYLEFKLTKSGCRSHLGVYVHPQSEGDREALYQDLEKLEKSLERSLGDGIEPSIDRILT